MHTFVDDTVWRQEVQLRALPPSLKKFKRKVIGNCVDGVSEAVLVETAREPKRGACVGAHVMRETTTAAN